ncbi:MAG: MBL fold metallo-hydrolase [Promethearchaeota archaeon]
MEFEFGMWEVVEHADGEVLEWRWASGSELFQEPFWTSAYLVGGLLIDCGPPAGEDDLREFLGSQGGQSRAVRCFVTHAHEDHAGGARMLTEELGVPTFASERAVKVIHQGLDYPDYRQLTWGPRMMPAPGVRVVQSSELRTGAGKYEFELFPMPGHAPCLVALIERNRQWAFVADGVMPKYQMIFGPTTNIEEDAEQIHRSLVRLERATEDLPDLVLFISGRGRRDDGRRLIGEKVQELESLHERAHALHGAGVKKRRILRELWGGESFIGIFTRGDLSRMNLLNSLLAWPLEARGNNLNSRDE